LTLEGRVVSVVEALQGHDGKEVWHGVVLDLVLYAEAIGGLI
jgi:hypothetical protein